jgi:serine protease
MSTLRADDIWAITDGEGTTVAVLDTGVSVNTDGIARLLADQCRDFVNQTACVPDAQGHGTHVAGTIAQKNDNGIGVTGLAPGVSILPIRVLDDNGMGRSIDIAAGIVYAVDQGADVINLSLGGYIESEARYQAIQYALDNDVTVVASTGNQGFTHTITFPAAYEGVIAVGAVNMAGEVTGYSNKHQKIPVILAPGGDLSKDDDGDGVPDGILQESLVDGNWGFYAVEGTSSAAAHVSASAALLHAAGLTKPSEIRGTLLDTRDNLNTVSPLDALRTVRPTESHPMPGPQ